jgi:hypothetical protein
MAADGVGVDAVTAAAADTAVATEEEVTEAADTEYTISLKIIAFI